MTRALALVLFLVAAPAVADPTPSTPAAEPAVAAAPVAKPATCKKVVVGRGLDRKVICEVEAEIPVHSSAPAPNVVIVHASPRHVVGRPKSGNRLAGLSQRLR